jgi:Holliday junction resolvasome RuvABC ATP-dependent DNA helicase subunit
MINATVRKLIDETYAPCVGQDRVKTQMRFNLKGLAHTQYLPHTLFIAERGAGKTFLCGETAKAIAKIRKEAHGATKVNLIEANGAVLKSVKVLFEQIVLPHLSNEQVAVLFIDEFHEIGEKVRAVLLSILQPTKDKTTTFTYDGGDVTFDFRRISVLAATTEGQKIFPALRDRFSEINLEEPTRDDLAEIMRRNLDKCVASDSALTDIASYCRGNCRSAVKMAGNVSNFCHNNDTRFRIEHVKELVKIVNIYPLGVSPQELAIMRHLAKDTRLSMKSLCARTGLTGAAQQDAEKFLLRHGLLTIDGERKLTVRGHQYLKDLANF